MTTSLNGKKHLTKVTCKNLTSGKFQSSLKSYANEAYLKTQNKQVQHKAVVLHNKGGELQTAYDPVRVGVVHVLVVDDDVVLGCHVISDVVVHDQTQQSEEKLWSNRRIKSKFFVIIPVSRDALFTRKSNFITHRKILLRNKQQVNSKS